MMRVSMVGALGLACLFLFFGCSCSGNTQQQDGVVDHGADSSLLWKLAVDPAPPVLTFADGFVQEGGSVFCIKNLRDTVDSLELREIWESELFRDLMENEWLAEIDPFGSVDLAMPFILMDWEGVPFVIRFWLTSDGLKRAMALAKAAGLKSVGRVVGYEAFEGPNGSGGTLTVLVKGNEVIWAEVDSGESYRTRLPKLQAQGAAWRKNLTSQVLEDHLGPGFVVHVEKRRMDAFLLRANLGGFKVTSSVLRVVLTDGELAVKAFVLPTLASGLESPEDVLSLTSMPGSATALIALNIPVSSFKGIHHEGLPATLTVALARLKADGQVSVVLAEGKGVSVFAVALSKGQSVRDLMGEVGVEEGRFEGELIWKVDDGYCASAESSILVCSNDRLQLTGALIRTRMAGPAPTSLIFFGRAGGASVLESAKLAMLSPFVKDVAVKVELKDRWLVADIQARGRPQKLVRQAIDAARDYLGLETKSTQSLSQARRGFKTKLITLTREDGRLSQPPSDRFSLVQFPTALGRMGAYLSTPKDTGQKHPAIVWLTGGFPASSGSEPWVPGPPENEQSAAAYWKAGVVTMYPTVRGTLGNPGFQEAFFGEVDDVIAAARYLATLDSVDPNRIYLGGHSTGGTLALLAATTGYPFRGVFAFGPVAEIAGYGIDDLPFDSSNPEENRLRAPINFLSGVRAQTFVIEGEIAGNADSLDAMRRASDNPNLSFIVLKGRSHFTGLGPMNDEIARQIMSLKGDGRIELKGELGQGAQ